MKTKNKKREKYQPEHGTLATLLGSGEGIIRMNYPSLSRDLKIAEHTKSCPCVSGCLLFACIKVKIAALFCDTHSVSAWIVTDWRPPSSVSPNFGAENIMCEG